MGYKFLTTVHCIDSNGLRTTRTYGSDTEPTDGQVNAIGAGLQAITALGVEKMTVTKEIDMNTASGGAFETISTAAEANSTKFAGAYISAILEDGDRHPVNVPQLKSANISGKTIIPTAEVIAFLTLMATGGLFQVSDGERYDSTKLLANLIQGKTY